MIKKILNLALLLSPFVSYAQTGHLMQGIGAVNMSMGGASTAQPIDISGALEWNPATVSTFSGSKILKADVGLFFSSPELSSTYGPYSGVTKDQKGASVMPAIAYVWGKEGCKSTFGVSAFGISGFGVDFPQNNSNPISMSQPNGFGHLESNYMLMQVGFTWAYKFSDNFSVGIQPNIDYSALKLNPNPLASPSSTLGYPKTNNASSIGFGGQIGVFYDSHKGYKAGISYKTQQIFGKFNFKDTFLDGSDAGKVKFQMNYPAVLSIGVGYSVSDFDLAVDYRYVDYEHTKGFEAKGWTIDGTSGYPTGSLNGFGWKNISTVSAGIQYKGINKLPLRIGYTYSGNPIDKDLAFFSLPATAIIKNAVQCGFSYEASDKVALDFVYHHGMSSGSTSGSMLSPYNISSTNPYGAISGSNVSYKMTTDMVMVGFSYKFN